MVKLKILLVSVLTLALVAAGVQAAAAGGNCSAGEMKTNECPTANLTEDAVELSVGGGSGSGSSGSGSSGGGNSGSGNAGGNNNSGGSNSGGGGGFTVPQRPADPTGRDGFIVTSQARLSDIASFRPTPGRALMQPDGWMVVGLDTNFFAQASTHLVGGTLLGQPATVRFTPVSYRWQYGDGSSTLRTVKGASWQALGVPEFSQTPTSHIYDDPGRYVIRLTVNFAAEYQYVGGEWIPVLGGTLAVPANELVAVAGSAKTVLVARDCLVSPSGPGC